MSDEQTPQQWDREAVTFDDTADHGLRDPATRAAWRELLLGVLPAVPARLADLGCGTGTLSVLLAEEGYAVEGVDFSPEMIRRATAKAGGRASFRIGDAAAPDLEPGAYDVVLSRHVLWLLPDPQGAVRRWTELLAPGGRLVLIEGRWSTGAGLSAAECERIVARVRPVLAVRPLPEPVYWGREISDERYLVIS